MRAPNATSCRPCSAGGLVWQATDPVPNMAGRHDVPSATGDMGASGLPAQLADRDVRGFEPKPQRVVERPVEEGQSRAIEVLDNGPHLLFSSLAHGHQLLILSRHRGPQAAMHASVGARKSSTNMAEHQSIP